MAACYRACYALADEHRLKSIAFPAISTGIFGYPLDAATAIAVAEARDYGERADGRLERIIFCCFGADVTEVYRQACSRQFE